MLKGLHRLSKALRRARKKRGAIDFDFPEAEITLNKKGFPLEVQARTANEATRLIEDCMLCANETVAKHFFEAHVPMAYRNHGAPDPERTQELLSLLKTFGVSLRTKGKVLSPREVQRLLKKSEGLPEEGLINFLTLRSMQRAEYGEKNQGHFGLAAPYYLHFTSPIRRYPDLMVHRIIKHSLRGRLGEDRIEHYKDLLPGICQHCSATERAAEEAERECEKLKKAEYMGSHLGEAFTGKVSGMNVSGFYVELPNTVEGMVPMASLTGDHFYFDKDHYCVKGAKTGRVIKIGEEVRVLAEAVNPYARTIDFQLEE